MSLPHSQPPPGRSLQRAIKALAVWLLILVCAFLNGALREFVLFPWLGNPAALMLSGVLLAACILALAFMFVPRFGILTVPHYLLLGLFWLALTFAFEIGFGLLRHQGWSVILEAYTFRNGNLWPLVLAVTFLSPIVAARSRGLI